MNLFRTLHTTVTTGNGILSNPIYFKCHRHTLLTFQILKVRYEEFGILSNNIHFQYVILKKNRIKFNNLQNIQNITMNATR